MLKNILSFEELNEKFKNIDYGIKVNIPSINKKAYKDHETKLIINKINSIKSAYGSLIAKFSKVLEIPKEIILSTIFIESSGNKNAKSGSGAVGLMQLKPDSASDIVNIKKRKIGLSDTEKKVLKSNLNEENYKCLINMPYAGKYPCGTNPLNDSDLKNTTLNILIGCMYLKLLINENKESHLRLDKLIARYNQGYFYKTPSGDYTEFYNKVPDETKKYILRFLGINGVLDIINKNNLA